MYKYFLTLKEKTDSSLMNHFFKRHILTTEHENYNFSNNGIVRQQRQFNIQHSLFRYRPGWICHHLKIEKKWDV